jgi:hypothetical protein
MTDKGMIVLQNPVYPQQDVHIPCSHKEACASSSHSGDQTVNIKVEKLSHVQDGDVPATLEGLKAEHEVSSILLYIVCYMYYKHDQFTEGDRRGYIKRVWVLFTLILPTSNTMEVTPDSIMQPRLYTMYGPCTCLCTRTVRVFMFAALTKFVSLHSLFVSLRSVIHYVFLHSQNV